MNYSIEGRIKIILSVAITLVVLMGGVTLYYFSEVNDNIENSIGHDIKLISISQKMRSVFYELKADERLLIHTIRSGRVPESGKTAFERIQNDTKALFNLIEEFESHTEQTPGDIDVSLLKKQLTQYKSFVQTAEEKRLSGTGISYLKLQKDLSKLREEINRVINNIVTFGSQRFIMHQNYLGHLLNHANRNLIFLITLAILAGGIIFYLAPQKVTRPIRLFINSIKELRELKFETRLPVAENNELNELGKQINEFVTAFVEFDDMKRKKIQFEKRKMQVLADILNLGVVIISIEGEVLFLNAQMAKFLNLSTESFQKKDFHFVRFPEEMKDLFEDAIIKKEKFENRMVILTYEKDGEDGQKHDEAVELLVDAGMVRNYVGDVANIILTFEDISDQPQESIFKRISFNKPASF